MDKEILTTAQVAKLLGISVRTAQVLIEGGSLPSWKTPGGHRRVRHADVLALMATAPRPPVVASTVVIVVASPDRLARYEQILAEVTAHSIEGYADPQAAMFAIGSRLPAAVVIDLEEASSERLALLGHVTSNPALSHTRVVAVGGHDVADAAELGTNERAHVSLPAPVPEALRAALDAAGNPLELIRGPTTFPLAPNEGQRLLALERAGIVDTPPEETFDRITWLASYALQAPVALLTILTPTRQWFKSRHGLQMTDTPRDWAFCNYTILQRDVLSVENLALDERFANNPAVAQPPRFRFYAGAPVLDHDGFALGSLCIIDYEPRTLDEKQRRALATLAALATDELRLRATSRELRWTLETRNRQQPRLGSKVPPIV